MTQHSARGKTTFKRILAVGSLSTIVAVGLASLGIKTFVEPYSPEQIASGKKFAEMRKKGDENLAKMKEPFAKRQAEQEAGQALPKTVFPRYQGPNFPFAESPACPSKPESCTFSQNPRLWGHTVWTAPDGLLNETDRTVAPAQAPLVVMPPENPPVNTQAIDVLVPPTGENGQPVYAPEPQDISSQGKSQASKTAPKMPQAPKANDQTTPKDAWDFTAPLSR